MLILVQTQTLTTTNSGQLEFKELSVVKTLLETTRGRVQAYFGSWNRYVPVWGSLFHLTANFCCGHQGLFIIHVLNFDLTKNAFFVLFWFFFCKKYEMYGYQIDRQTGTAHAVPSSLPIYLYSNIDRNVTLWTLSWHTHYPTLQLCMHAAYHREQFLILFNDRHPSWLNLKLFYNGEKCLGKLVCCS